MSLDQRLARLLFVFVVFFKSAVEFRALANVLLHLLYLFPPSHIYSGTFVPNSGLFLPAYITALTFLSWIGTGFTSDIALFFISSDFCFLSSLVSLFTNPPATHFSPP